MSTAAMTQDERERELVRMIRESKDPEKAIEVAIDVFTRMLAGEEPASIMARYGIDWEAVKNER